MHMCGENMYKTRLRCCQIATILVLLSEIVVAEHDGEGSFQTMRTKEIIKT